ncbi:mannose-6-phosphate isomerase, class I [Microbacterium hominis]|uniref:mannose-6-phosphate isomerase n=1 Tax=Microbacterium hominis TaxID=162426 RepID=A0A7D4UIN5_9MICO|nr:mannose-6-phosphate isomerase, class I [Microbacterium hominis]QKJ20008.1 mannose-6-phosphate isomerase, class I [Microbacterium hominis]
MLLPLTNTPRDYAWGSTTLLAELEGRAPSGSPEAEVWYGDHAGAPAITPDGRTLDVWLAEEGRAHGGTTRLPYLLKVLAAGSPLSIQAHPSIAQAQEGFAREEAAGIPRDAGERTYRDENHKPELIVAVSDTFRALAGLRPLERTRALVAALGSAAAPLARRLEGDADLGEVVGWVLSEDAGPDVHAIIGAALAVQSAEFASELSLVRELEAAYPGDPGIVVALLMNLVVLRRGEGLFVPAGVLHAYLEGLGVELMAASDNVLRGGLTPKHIDVAELLTVLDPVPGEPAVVRAEAIGPGVGRFPVPVTDFAMLTVAPGPFPAPVWLGGPAIVVATAGAPTVSAGAESISLVPGQAALVTADEQTVAVGGEGRVYIALPG